MYLVTIGVKMVSTSPFHQLIHTSFNFDSNPNSNSKSLGLIPIPPNKGRTQCIVICQYKQFHILSIQILIGCARLSSLERLHPILTNRKYHRIVLKWASSSAQAITIVHGHYGIIIMLVAKIS